MQLRYYGTLFLSLYATLNSDVQAAVPQSWKQGAYAYVAGENSLDTVLADFARGFGVNIEKDKNYTLPVEGTLRAADAESFLNRLAMQYKFQWFVYNDTLYINDIKDKTSRRIMTDAVSAAEAKQALIDIGLFEPRFGWGEMGNRGAVLISGPKKYVSFVEQFLSFPKDKASSRVRNMIFPVKHMSVVDRVIGYREQKLTVPGMATLVRSVMGNGVGDNSSSWMPEMEASSDKTLRTLAERNLPPGLAPYPEGGNGRIVADMANNAIIVRDDPSLRLEYQSLIQNLDKPKKIIGIKALLVDIDRNELNRLSINWLAKIGNTTISSMMGRRGTIGLNNLPNLLADINYLEGAGYARVSSSPSLVTLDNYPAVIDFNDTAYVKLTGENVANLKPISVGTSLRVTPRIITENNNRKIYLYIDIEDGKMKAGPIAENVNISRGEISTQAVMDESSALVIGSMQKRTTQQTESKVPILGDIPGIGKLFTNVNTTEQNRERIFLIFPEIIDETLPDNISNFSNLANAPHKEKNNEPFRYNISALLTSLDNGYAPKWLTKGGEGMTLKAFCHDNPQFAIQNNGQQFYRGQGYEVTIGTIYNKSNTKIPVPEELCKNPYTISVKYSPTGEISPGGTAKVLVAYKINIIQATNEFNRNTQTQKIYSGNKYNFERK